MCFVICTGPRLETKAGCLQAHHRKSMTKRCPFDALQHTQLRLGLSVNIYCGHHFLERHQAGALGDPDDSETLDGICDVRLFMSLHIQVALQGIGQHECA